MDGNSNTFEGCSGNPTDDTQRLQDAVNEAQRRATESGQPHSVFLGCGVIEVVGTLRLPPGGRISGT